ncbi:MAG: Ig-like domain-containing protein [Thermoprotei archaeon]
MAKKFTVLLVIFLVFSLSLLSGYSDRATVSSNSSSSWYVYYENINESAYRFDLGKNASGIEMHLYMNSSGDMNSDWVKFTFIGHSMPGSAYELVGLTRIGYNNDNQPTAGGGMHYIYYVLPQKVFIAYVNITLHSINGRPRLDSSRSFISVWEPSVNFYHIAVWNNKDGYGWYYYNITQKGKGRVALVSFGIPVGNQPMESGISYYLSKSFKPPNMAGKPEVYLEVSYAGGFNAAPESAFGKGNYRAKIDAGIGKGNWLNEAVHSGLNQTLYLKQKYSDLPALVAQEAADGMIDIIQELLTDVLPNVNGLYESIFFAIDVAQIISSLGFDEVVADRKILVFDNVDVDPNNMFYTWINFIGQVKSAGLTATLANFYGKFPFGSTIFDNLPGVSVADLPDGGFQIGGILLHYNIPVIESISPLGNNLPVTTGITLRFSKPIDRNSILYIKKGSSLVKNPDTIIATANSQKINFFDFFHFRDSPSNDLTVLIMSPNYHLDYNTEYVITFTSKILDIYGFGLEPFTFSFSTQLGPPPPRNIYYNITVAITTGQYEFGTDLRGEIFRAKIVNNVTFDQNSIVADGLIRTNDPLYDYWNEGFGWIFKSGDKTYFKLSEAHDGGVPPRSSTIFELIDRITLKTTLWAEAEVKNIEIGNKALAQALSEQIRLNPSTHFTLEPIIVKEYSAIGVDIGSVKFYNDEIEILNGKELRMYAILHTAPWDLIPDKPPAFYVKVSGALPMSLDIVVYSITNNFVGAWRFIPKSIEPKQFTYNYIIQVQGINKEIKIFSNSTISGFTYNQSLNTILFNVSGKNGTKGFTTVVIPKDLIKGTPKVLFDSNPISFKVNEMGENYYINFTYIHSKHSITIVLITSEEKNQINHLIIIISILLLATVLLVLITKKKLKIMNYQE